MYVRHMGKNHSHSERRNPLLPLHGVLLLAVRDLLYAPSHRQVSHTMVHVTSVVGEMRNG